MENLQSKVCIKCQQSKPLDQYYKTKNTCKACITAYKKAHWQRYKLIREARKRDLTLKALAYDQRVSVQSLTLPEWFQPVERATVLGLIAFLTSISAADPTTLGPNAPMLQAFALMAEKELASLVQNGTL
jgi:hypothetical protein